MLDLYSAVQVVKTYNLTKYNIVDMNMEILQALLRRHRNRGTQNFKNYHQLQEMLEPIAHNISERAHQFIKKVFQVDTLNEMEPLDWHYDIPNPTQSPMCSKVMTEHSEGSSFRCYDCMESSSSCMCEACFKAGNHQGHNYVQYTSVNGCCDCGNAEAWNQKGFCKTHTAINNLQIQLSSSLKKKYVEEGTLLIYIYFYLCFVQKTLRKEDLDLIKMYGKYIFNYFKRSSQKNYDMKLLGCCLLDSKIPAVYPKIIQEDLTILQIFFIVPQQKSKGYEELVHFFFELFPVEEHRKNVLIHYFKKMKRIDEKMIKQTPLAGLNFQYLSCVKLIISLIKKGELQPLQVFAVQPYLKTNESFEDIPEVYKKLYQDLDYVHNMKSAKEYEMLHLIKTNVADLAGYREYSSVAFKAKNKYLLANFNIDEMFIKILAKFVQKLKDEKEVLLKSIQELFHYIVNIEENYSSLAQERAFALLVLTYFQGDISQLASKQKKNQFIKEIYCTQEQLGMSLNKVIKLSLKTKINISKLKQPRRNMYESYFLRNNCQKNIPEFLDCIFHKILILLSQDICPYQKVVDELLKELTSEETQQQYYGDSDDEQNEVPSVCTKLQNMLVVMQLLNTITFIDMDEFIVAGLVKIINKPKIFAFFARIICTFKQLNVKQIKILCLQLINNEQLFQQFIRNYTQSEKGKLKLKESAKPLEYFNYNTIFKKFRFQLPETDITFLKRENNSDNVYAKIKMKILNAEMIQNIVQVYNQAVILLAEQANRRLHIAINEVTIELLKTQLNGSSLQTPYLFLQVMFNHSMRFFLFKNVMQQMTILSKKEQQFHKDLQKIKVDQAQQFRLKRQKIMNKRKIKEEIMKKNQEQVLNKFKHIEEIKCQSHDKPICIYCKGEKKEEQLSLISYLGLTNLIQKTILKQPTFHYFFTTCGHYIHSSCYIQANTKEIKKYCFLCKQQSNILIPDFITLPEQKTKQKAEQFLSNILSVLVNEYQLVDGKIGKYQTLIFENNEQILIESFAKELVYKCLHNYSYFKKNLYFLYLQIYEIIRFIDKEKMNKHLHFPLQPEKEVIKLQMLVNYVQLKLLDMIPYEDYSFLQINPQEIEQANNIIDVIKNKTPDTEISELKQISADSLFIKIPATLKELHMYMGKCKLCPNVTNNIYLCLNCGWSACLKCSAQIFKHVADEHLQGTAIMGCSTGSVKYVKQSLIFQDASIYENYLGLTFTDSDTIIEFSRADKYNLNLQKEQQVKSMMLRYQVHQKIKLNAHYL